MRIIYLHQYFITPEMAGGSRSYEMARRLVAAGHDVHVVTSDQDAGAISATWRETEEAGIQVHWTPVPYSNDMGYGRRILAFFVFAWRAALKASALRGDIVFATSTPLTIAIPAAYAKWRSKIPMVFEVRDLWPDVPIAIGAIKNPIAKYLARRLEKFAYSQAARVVALAPGMREHIVAQGYPPNHVVVIPNGCDIDLFADAEASETLRRRYDWLGSRPLLVFTGTFGLVNGMDYLVRLADCIQRIDSEVRVVAIGAGREFEKTHQLASDKGILDKSLFFLGRLPKVEVAAWTKAADMTIALFAGPEIVWRDAVQNKFFDSLAAGNPVANNFPGWQSKVAADAGAGLILSSQDTDAAARDVVDALRDKDWMTAAKAAAFNLARRRFDRDFLAMDLDRVLREVFDEAQGD